MRVRSRRYLAAREQVERGRRYTVAEACRLVVSMPKPKFDPTIQLSVRLNVDPKKADQALRGSVSLPCGLGADRRVIAFADGPEAEAAREAGALEVGMDELAQKIQGGWLEFDVCVAVQRAMRVASRLGKVLGPRGLMPTPKNGTVIPDGKVDEMRRTVREFRGGRVEYRTDATGNLHVPVGRGSFDPEKLAENVESFLDHIRRSRPASVRGTFLLSAALSPCMGPAVPLEVSG